MDHDRKSFPLLLATFFRDYVPRFVDAMERVHNDAGQAMVWLVGLASTLLALAVANPEKVAAIAGGVYYTVLCVALLATIAAGVVCRLLALASLNVARHVFMALGAHMAGYVAGSEAHCPASLSQAWDEEEIVRRFQSELGRDYGFLLTYNVPLAGCRDAYEKAYSTDDLQFQRQVTELNNTVAAHIGLRDGAELQRRALNDDAARRRARYANGLGRAAGVMFVLSSLSFVMAMSVVARGLIRMAPH